MPKNIYLDYAATTPVDQRVIKAMAPYWEKKFGNASSLYALGRSSQQALQQARQIVARYLHCHATEIIFTGGGTASINLALQGLFLEATKPSHLIISAIEHHAVLETARWLKKIGHQVSILPVDRYGLINLKDLNSALKNNTLLVSIIMANNEIGTIQPIQKIGALLQKINHHRKIKKLAPIYFHSDACQAAGALDLNLQKLHVDLLTINGSKIYGPKGTGILYVKTGTPLTALLHGGGQEKNLYSGTENIPGIIGLATALTLVQKNRLKENARLVGLRDWLIREILTTVPKTILNGHPQQRLPNNINISFLDIEGEALLLHLDRLGIEASTGSACSSASLEPSHVIRALGYPAEVAHGSLRLTLGKNTRRSDLQYLLRKLPLIIKTLRHTSAIKLDLKKIEKTLTEFPRRIINL